MTKLNPSYKSSVDFAILYGKSHLSLHNVVKTQHNIKKLQKAIRQYAKKLDIKVSTYHDKIYDELVITRKPLNTTKYYSPSVVAEVVGQEVPSLQNRAFEYVPSFRETKSLSYEFKVGDSGTLFCGEPYVVLEKKRNGELLVNVKSKGSWKIGLRKSDGTCVYDYPNKHRFALLPPVQTDLAIPPKPTRKCNFWVNIYENYVSAHIQEEDAKQFVDEKDALAIALPVTIEFAPRI